MTVNDQVFEALAERFGGIDSDLVDQLQTLIDPLEGLCAIINSNKTKFGEIKRGLNETLGVEEFTSVPEGRSLMFMRSLYNGVRDVLIRAVRDYETIESHFSFKVKGKLSVPTDGRVPPISTLDAVKIAPRLASQSCSTLLDILERLPKVLKATYKLVEDHNAYLKERFVKTLDEPAQQAGPRVLFIPSPEEQQAKYVRIKLIEGSPLLTDVLLDFMDRVLPTYNERRVRQRGRRERVVREVHEFQVNEAAASLVYLGDRTILGYLKDPALFFQRVGGTLDMFYSVFRELFPSHLEVIESPSFRFVDEGGNRIEERLQPEKLSPLERGIVKVKIARFQPINQKDEDYQGNTRKEREYFKLRDELLLTLYTAMTETSSLRADVEYEEKERIAKKAILRGMDLKSRIEELLRSPAERRLRRDRHEDNDYYEASQQGMGTVEFQRKPAPRVRMEEVIGTSFDPVKTHLGEIIETGKYPRIMQLSAPGGKVKSNILIIGPYGCGKTELSRAVCGDRRVIGASVSITATQTAFMHESVNNVRRVYDGLKKLYDEGMGQKPVIGVLDEFDGWFARGDAGMHSSIDAQQIETTLLEILDGMRDYNGIVTIAMTNKPMMIPAGILRRFRYVDVVGQLTDEERSSMLKMYLEKTLPVSPKINEEYYAQWAAELRDAPGDVVRKAVDEIHFGLVPEYIRRNPKEAGRIERNLQEREMRKGQNDDTDITYLQRKLRRFREVQPEDVQSAIKNLLQRPTIDMQIKAARRVYQEAQEIMHELADHGAATGFGMRRRKEYF